jgi:hypothetical protein
MMRSAASCRLTTAALRPDRAVKIGRVVDRVVQGLVIAEMQRALKVFVVARHNNQIPTIVYTLLTSMLRIVQSSNEIDVSVSSAAPGAASDADRFEAV